MIYIEASPHLRLRPSHLLLMIYRYASGVYQVGDLSALNYLKGFLDGSSVEREGARVLTVSGHGIGEAERWLASRLAGCTVDSVSFRLVDTQLLHALRIASPEEIEALFGRFAALVAPYPTLGTLASDPGLIPYWCEQAALIAACFQTGRVNAFSDSPFRIPASRRYDLVYVSQGGPYFTLEAAERLRNRLESGGLLAALAPARSVDGFGSRFATSQPVGEAKALFGQMLEQRGYAITAEAKPPPDLATLATRREVIRFNVLAPAHAVLVGELILASLAEHISDRHRLEVLEEAAARFIDLQLPVSEELELCMMGAER